MKVGMKKLICSFGIIIGFFSLNAFADHRDPGQNPGQNPGRDAGQNSGQGPIACRGGFEFKKSDQILSESPYLRRLELRVKAPRGCKSSYYAVEGVLPKNAEVSATYPDGAVLQGESESRKVAWVGQSIGVGEEKVYQVDYHLESGDSREARSVGCVTEGFDPSVCSSG